MASKHYSEDNLYKLVSNYIVPGYFDRFISYNSYISIIFLPITIPLSLIESIFSGAELKEKRNVAIDKIKKGDEVVGGRVRVKVVKNKVASPFKQTEFDLMYNEGISKEGEIIALGEKFGLIEKKGSTYSYGEEKMGVGYDKARTFLKENKKIANEIVKKIKEELKKS